MTRTNQDNSNSTKKIKVYFQVFHDSKDEPFRWKDIKHLELQDEDIINIQWVEPYYSENNSWDGHFSAEITRSIEETDEQFNERMLKNEKMKAELKARRYETFLKLKSEFEPENNSKKDLEDSKS